MTMTMRPASTLVFIGFLRLTPLVIIPVDVGYFSVDGLDNMLDMLTQVRKTFNTDLNLLLTSIPSPNSEKGQKRGSGQISTH